MTKAAQTTWRGVRWALIATLWMLASVGCGSSLPTAASAADASEPARLFSVAMKAEATDSLSAAPYLAAIDHAVEHPDLPTSFATVVAATDALVTRTDATAIAYRSRDTMAQAVDRLRQAWGRLDAASAQRAPLIKGVIARALHELALDSGEENGASIWSARRGCLMRATNIGPLGWTPLTDLSEPTSVAPTGALSASFAGVVPFEARVTPFPVHADACALPVDVVSAQPGVRAIVIDLQNDKAQRLSFALTSSSAAVLEVGGVPVLRRAFEAGGQNVTRFGSVEVDEGTVRVVARVAQKGDSAEVEIAVWGEDGRPLPSRAPRPGDEADAAAREPEAIGFATNSADRHMIGLMAAAHLGAGDSRASAQLLEPVLSQAIDPGSTSEDELEPILSLLYARAILAADALPEPTLIERRRAAVERAAQAWPSAWEPKIGRAWLTERRRGFEEGAALALAQLGVDGETGTTPDEDPMVLVAIAQIAARADLMDVADNAYERLSEQIFGSMLLADLDAALHRRAGAESVQVACEGGQSRQTRICLGTLISVDEHARAIEEIERLRKLRQAPESLRVVEMTEHVRVGEVDKALAVYDAMYPKDRSLLTAVGLAAGKGQVAAVESRLARDMADAMDAVVAIPALVSALDLTPDPAILLEEEGAALVAADRKNAFLPGAGTAVLKRVEHYHVKSNGLVHFLVYDLRRVSGTADVDRGADAYGPMIEGRGYPRVLRRRIHKKDGRVIHPDAARRAAQANTDLSQLETGDYIEQVMEGWSLPSDSGQLVIDTPDLLPERTSVRFAEVELRTPTDIEFSQWSHPLLGKADTRVVDGTRIQRFRIENKGARRIEDGVPYIERAVNISIGTQTWQNVGRSIGESIRALNEKDPFMARYAKEARGEGENIAPKELVARVVTHVGKTIKIANAGELSDVAAMYGGGAQRRTARMMIEVGLGSRSWVIYRTLQELGIEVDLAIAETQPFSSDPSFPPHVGRFRHPLLVVHLADEDIWIDADVDGPPLPPGRISPELRGRNAILASGDIVVVEGTRADASDTIDVRLTLDQDGNAEGTFTVLLRGRAAQGLAEAFETVVGADRRDILRVVVQAWLPWADVEDVKLSSEEGSWEIALRADVRISGLGRPEGKEGKVWVLPGIEPVHLVLSNGYVGTLGATYASRGGRKDALSIQSPMQYEFRRRIELPAGAKVVHTPAAVQVKSPRLVASRVINVTGNVLTEDFKMSLPTGTIGASEYDTFVNDVRVIDDGFMAGIRVEVSP